MELAQGDGRIDDAVLIGHSHLLTDGFHAHIAYLSAAMALNSDVDAETKLDLSRIFLEGYLEVEDPHLTYACEVLRQVLYLRSDLAVTLVGDAMQIALESLSAIGLVPQTINLDEFAWLLKLYGTSTTLLTLVSHDDVSRDDCLYLTGCLLEWGKLSAAEIPGAALASMGASFLPLARWGDRVSGVGWEQVSPPSSFTVEPPRTVPTVLDHAGIQSLIMASRGLRFAHFERATVVGGSSLTVVSGGVGYCDFLDFPESTSASCASDVLLAGFAEGCGLVRNHQGDTLRPFDRAISLLGSVNLEHGHLIPDTLSRLVALQRDDLRDLPILIDETPNRHATDFISRFVDAERLITIPRGSRADVEWLIRPLPTTYSPPGINNWENCIPGVAPWDPEGFAFVQQRVRPPRNTLEPTRRVFIHRELSNQRRALLNQVELENLTENFGYESVNPGILSVDAQMQLFADASHVIVQSGAAAFNVIACHPEARIAVLIGDDLFNWRGFACPVAQSVDEITFVTGASVHRPIPHWQVPFEVAAQDLLRVLERWHGQNPRPVAPNPDGRQS